MTGVTEQLALRLDWSAAETAHAQHVNQALGQVGPQRSDGMPDGIYVTMGSANPPAILDSDIAREQLVARLRVDGVKVNVLGQFHMSRPMLGDLIKVLQTTADKYDAVVRQASQKTPDGTGDEPV